MSETRLKMVRVTTMVLVAAVGSLLWVTAAAVPLRFDKVDAPAEDPSLREALDGCSTVYYYDDTATAVVWKLPQGGAQWIAERFETPGSIACSLKTVRVMLHRPSLKGTPNVEVGIWTDDGTGYPSSLLTSVVVPYAAIPTGTFVWATADFTSMNLVLPGDAPFHIGIRSCCPFEPGDTLAVVSDNGQGPHSGEHRSTYFGTEWATFFETMGTDYVFVFEADMGCEWVADADINNDGIALAVADLSYLAQFIAACGETPPDLHSADLNGDCIVDTLDIKVFQNYLMYGMSVFAPYGGYPVPTCCGPTAVVIPDTLEIWGLQHTSLGTACLEAAGESLEVTRLGTDGGVRIDLNGKDWIWHADISPLDSGGAMPVGSSMIAAVYGELGGQPEDHLISTTLSKVSATDWELTAQSDAATYAVEIIRDGVVLHRYEGVIFGAKANRIVIKDIEDDVWDDTWTERGGFLGLRRIASGVSCHSGADITLYPEGTEYPGVTHIRIETGDLGANTGGFSHVLFTRSAGSPTFRVISETAGLYYSGLSAKNLGNAVLTLVDSTLVVSNLGASGVDGFDVIPAEHDADDGDWAIVAANPDPSGTLPVGASVETEFYFEVGGQADSLMTALSMTKAATNTWNVGALPSTILCNVSAYYNNASVFSVAGISVSSLGFIEATAKGVYPVGFKGGASSLPPQKLVSTMDCSAAPNGVLWTWPGHGITDLRIDSLTLTYQNSDTSVHGPTHAALCGANGDKGDPISLTVLSIVWSPSSCCINRRGNVNGDAGDGVNVSDLTYLVNYLFKDGPVPQCLEEADVNGNVTVNVADLTYLVNFLFKAGPLAVLCP